MSIPADGLLADILQRLGLQEQTTARQDAEIEDLQKSSERLERMIIAMDSKVEAVRSELADKMDRGFDRVADGLDKVRAESLKAFSPEAAQQLAETKASEAASKASRTQAWVIAGIAALVGVGGFLWPHHL